MTKETKQQKFKRIASLRTQKVLDSIRKLGNCSNSGSYEYNQAQVRKIFSTINNELNKAKSRFNSNTDGNGKFSLH